MDRRGLVSLCWQPVWPRCWPSDAIGCQCRDGSRQGRAQLGAQVVEQQLPEAQDWPELLCYGANPLLCGDRVDAYPRSHADLGQILGRGSAHGSRTPNMWYLRAALDRRAFGHTDPIPAPHPRSRAVKFSRSRGAAHPRSRRLWSTSPRRSYPKRHGGMCREEAPPNSIPRGPTQPRAAHGDGWTRTMALAAHRR